MNEKNNFEFLSQEELKNLDNNLKSIEKIELPESLSPENIEQKLKEIPQHNIIALNDKPKKKSRKKIVFRSIAAAAAVIVAVTSVAIIKPWEDAQPPVAPIDSVIGKEPQKTEDYTEIETLFAKYAKNYKNKYVLHYGILDNKGSMEIIDDEALQENATANSSTGSASNVNKAPSATNHAAESLQSDDSSHGETNEQVAGVSEADIIKNDGKYLYVVNPDNADWEKYYTEFEKIAFDDNLVTGTTAKAQTTPSYKPFEKTNKETEKDEKSEIKAKERPILDYSCSVSIIEPEENGRLSEKAVLTIQKPADKDLYYMRIQEIYVKGARLIAILNCNKYVDESTAVYNGSTEVSCYSSAYYGKYNPVTMAVSYDLSDLKNIKEEWRIYQEGGYISSRLINDELVLLSNYYVDISKDEEAVKKNCVPEIAVDSESFDRISKNDICIMDEVRDSRYLVASVMNVNEKESLQTQAVLGGGENVYCTTETLYITSTDYGGTNSVKEIFGVESNEKTQIYKFDIRDYQIKYLKNASVSGSALNQFSIDEYNGYLRIATTLGSWGENLVNQVYILDENLETKGLLKDIAKGEMIKSVRFAGETAYVVTFVQTDPLFVIDLSKPEDPQILGEVKIPGYSAYLHPVGNGLVMGVGLDGTETGTNGGLKVSLFDVSDPQKPAECGKFTISVNNTRAIWEYIDSDAYFDHKALCWDSQNKIMYIPYMKSKEVLVNIDTYEYNISEETGIISLKVDEENKELKYIGTYKASTKESDGSSSEFTRATYIDDILFAFSGHNGILYSFNKSSTERIDVIKSGN